MTTIRNHQTFYWFNTFAVLSSFWWMQACGSDANDNPVQVPVQDAGKTTSAATAAGNTAAPTVDASVGIKDSSVSIVKVVDAAIMDSQVKDSGRKDAAIKDAAVATKHDGGSDAAKSEAIPSDCPKQSLGAGEKSFTINSANGQTYQYSVVVPKNYKSNMHTPVTIIWHALSSDPTEMRSVSDYETIQEKLGYIFVYPVSPDKSWDVGSCCTSIVSGTARDETVFAKELIAEVKSKVCVDSKRIYTMGFSNGGMISQMLACKQADIFAAAAVAGSTLTIASSLSEAQTACQPSRPIPMIMINGTSDPLVGYSAASFSGGLTVVDDYSFWVSTDKCTGSPKQTLQKGQITCNTYDKCSNGVELTQCVAEGMGHCMPGMKTESDTNCLTKVAFDVLPISLGAPNNDVDGVQLSFEFLKRWSLP